MLDREDVQGGVAGDEAEAELRLQVGGEIGEVLTLTGGIDAHTLGFEAHYVAFGQASAIDDWTIDECESAKSAIGLIQQVFHRGERAAEGAVRGLGEFWRLFAVLQFREFRAVWPGFEEVDRQFARGVAKAQFKTIRKDAAQQTKIIFLSYGNVGSGLDIVEPGGESPRFIEQLSFADAVEPKDKSVHRTGDVDVPGITVFVPVLALRCRIDELDGDRFEFGRRAGNHGYGSLRRGDQAERGH